MATRTRAGLRLVVPLILAGALLMGCSSDDDAPAPSGTPTPADTATPEPTPADDATTSPEPDPTAELEAEITAFFEEYIDAVNESWTSEEALRRRREMFADSCEACLVGYEFAEQAHTEQLEFDGGKAVVNEVELTNQSSESPVFLSVADFPQGRLVKSDGTVVVDFDESINRQTVYQAARDVDGELIIIASETL